MKTLLNIVTLVCAALSMFSCTKNEESFHQDKVELTTIGCSIPTDTKTSLDIASHKMTWNAGDQIGVAPVGLQFPGYDQNVATQHTGIAPYSILEETISSDRTSARFQGPSQNESTAIIAVYPYKSPNAEPFTEIQKYSHHYSWANSNNIFFPVPSVQYFVENKVQDGIIPMYAYCEDPSLNDMKFKYAASIINFQLKASTSDDIKVTKITITSKTLSIAGDRYFDWNELKAGGKDTPITGMYLGEKQIQYLFDAEGKTVSLSPFDVNIILAGCKEALTIEVYFKAGSVIKKAILKTNTITFKDGVIKKFGVVDLDRAEILVNRSLIINETENTSLAELSEYLTNKKQENASYSVSKIKFEDPNTTYSEVVSALMSVKGYLNAAKELAIDMSPINNTGFTSFEQYFFSKCGYTSNDLRLTYIKFPESVTTLPTNSFRMYHTMAGEIDFNKVTTIEDIAFYQHTLNEANHDYTVTIPATVTNIGYANFVNSKEITVVPENPNYESRCGVLFEKGSTIILSMPQNQPYETLKLGYNDGEEEGVNGTYCKLNATGHKSILILKNLVNLRKVVFADGFNPSGTILSYSSKLHSIVFATMTLPKFQFGGMEEWPGKDVADGERKIYLPKELLEDENAELKAQWEDWAKCITTDKKDDGVTNKYDFKYFHGVWTIDYTYTLAELKSKSTIAALTENPVIL